MVLELPSLNERLVVLHLPTLWQSVVQISCALGAKLILLCLGGSNFWLACRCFAFYLLLNLAEISNSMEMFRLHHDSSATKLFSYKFCDFSRDATTAFF